MGEGELLWVMTGMRDFFHSINMRGLPIFLSDKRLWSSIPMQFVKLMQQFTHLNWLQICTFNTRTMNVPSFHSFWSLLRAQCFRFILVIHHIAFCTKDTFCLL